MKAILLLLLSGLFLSLVALTFLGDALNSACGTQAPCAFSNHASQSLVRISQLDPAQYASPQEAQLWSASACSTASMTEVLDAYGLHLRIADVLAVENALHGISPTLGMLYPQAIAQTVSHFGFRDTRLTHASLPELIALAHAGTPAIVNFPPAPGPWSTGHLLVLLGGDTHTVHLADSSSLHLTSVAQTQFLAWWGGTADIVTPVQPNQNSASPVGTPPGSLTNSYAREAWQIALTYHLPPAAFVAQIQQESGFNPKAVSSAGAVGIAQFLPSTAACLDRDALGHCLGIDPGNPEQALAGAAYLMEKSWLGYLAQSPQDSQEAYRKALAAYNAGAGSVQQAVLQCGATRFLSCMPAETQHYVAFITSTGGL